MAPEQVPCSRAREGALAPEANPDLAEQELKWSFSTVGFT